MLLGFPHQVQGSGVKVWGGGVKYRFELSKMNRRFKLWIQVRFDKGYRGTSLMRDCFLPGPTGGPRGGCSFLRGRHPCKGLGIGAQNLGLRAWDRAMRAWVATGRVSGLWLDSVENVVGSDIGRGICQL